MLCANGEQCEATLWEQAANERHRALIPDAKMRSCALRDIDMKESGR